MTWNFNGWLYGIGQDGIGAPAGIAFLQTTGLRGILAPQPALIGAPFSQANYGATADPLWWLAGLLLSHLFTAVGAVNALIFAAIVGTAAATYVLLRRRRVPPAASMLGALIYGFCPIRLAEAQEHFLLLDGFWFVIESALLMAFAESLRKRWALCLGLCIGLTELDNPYLGYFGGVLAGGWLAWLMVRGAARRDWRGVRSVSGGAVLALMALLVVAIPTQLLLLRSALWDADPGDSVPAVVRSMGDVDRLSLRWWNFLLPAPANPILGSFGRQTFYDHLGVDTASEQSTMVGYVALMLSLSGGVLVVRRTRQAPAPATSDLAAIGQPTAPMTSGDNVVRPLATLGLTCIVTGIAFGLPPTFVIGPITIPMPPYFVHALLPEIRTTSRIDLLIQLGIAIFAALGAAQLLALIRTPRWRNAAAGLLVVSIILEYTNAPPWHSVSLLPAPPFYDWLASLSAKQAGIVVQYPIAASDQALTPLYAFYAYVVHHHPLFNGVVGGTPPDSLRLNLEDPLNPTVPASWAALGVRTVAIDRTFYQSRFGNSGLRWSDDDAGFVQKLPRGLIQRYHDAQWTAFTVTAPPAQLIAGIGNGFGDVQLLNDGREWRWMGDRATVWVDNVTGHPVHAVLWTLAHNNAVAHTLAWPGYLSVPLSTASDRIPVAVAVRSAPGLHPITIQATGGTLPLEGSGNITPVSVLLRSFEPAPVRPLTADFIQNGTTRWELSGVSSDACTIQAGGALHVALLWGVKQPTGDDQTVFVHLIDQVGKLVAQDDGLPEAGTIATSLLAPSANLVDVHTLQLPRSLRPGNYRLQAGLYNGRTGARLAIASGGDMVDLGTMTVDAPSPGPHRLPCPW